jgi:hypothetical protein
MGGVLRVAALRFAAIEARPPAAEKLGARCRIAPLRAQCKSCRRALFDRRLLVEPVWYTVYQGGQPLDPQVELMAVDPSGGHSAMDYPEHLRTYSGFLRATMILIAFVVAVLLFLLTLVP